MREGALAFPVSFHIPQTSSDSLICCTWCPQLCFCPAWEQSIQWWPGCSHTSLVSDLDLDRILNIWRYRALSNLYLGLLTEQQDLHRPPNLAQLLDSWAWCQMCLWGSDFKQSICPLPLCFLSSSKMTIAIEDHQRNNAANKHHSKHHIHHLASYHSFINHLSPFQ